jgi:hypothetical protein
MPYSFSSPYLNSHVNWLKGNLHAHTTESDGARPPQEVIDSYAAHGYDFLCISDHDVLVDPSKLDSRGMTLIPGNEVTANGPHILHVDARTVVPPDPDRQKVLSGVADDHGFAVVPHPNWEEDFNHCPQSLLESWKGYIGVEVYNGVVRRLEGSPVATDRWDMLLSKGRRIWGFAHDDSHRPCDDEIGWDVVQSDDRSAKAIVTALREGRFYASTGVSIESVQVHGKTAKIVTRDAECIIAFSNFGHREAKAEDREMVFTLPEHPDFTYVRFECWGRGERMAWSQPLFVEKD